MKNNDTNKNIITNNKHNDITDDNANDNDCNRE